MRVFALLSLIVALATSVAPGVAGQEGVRQASDPPVRHPSVPSDLLAHSPLAACSRDELPVADAPKRSRIVTWNIHARRTASVSAIAAELQAMQADVIALQEVDVRTRRSGFTDEPSVLAAALGFHHVFAGSIKWDEGDYGLAVFSRWPLTEVRRHRLQATAAGELRIVLEVTVCAGGRRLRLFNHHADGRAASRNGGFIEFLKIVEAAKGDDIVVLGDFNDRADSPGVRGFVDTGLIDLGARRDERTSDNGRIDYVLPGGPLARLPWTARVWLNDLSDHEAVLADVEW